MDDLQPTKNDVSPEAPTILQENGLGQQRESIKLPTQSQCELKQNSNTIQAYLGMLGDLAISVILDRTGNPNSTYDERLDANRRHRVGECMKGK